MLGLLRWAFYAGQYITVGVGLSEVVEWFGGADGYTPTGSTTAGQAYIPTGDTSTWGNANMVMAALGWLTAIGAFLAFWRIQRGRW